ncbi:MAG TPA: protein kinase [Myxococcales bacterium]|jgi:serine/threonine-protein kinase
MLATLEEESKRTDLPAPPDVPSSNAKAGLRPFTPTRFGRYTLLAPLATGGMAQVFLARVSGVEGFEKLFVIKKILSHLAADEYFVDRFLDEGKIVVKLQHGSIAQVIDMGREGDEYYIAMEFVDGKDLRKIAARCRDQAVLLPTGLALFVFVRILDALAYAHRKRDDQDRELNLVHRDISPQNILVSYEGEVKIIDFGLAKSALSLTRTSPSVILGKFFYMSPEQARHQPADRRSDLYATGICLWEMLAGRNPFDDTPPGEILRVVANPAIPLLRDVCPDVPEALNDVVMKALAPDPTQRFQSAEEMRGRLTAAMLEVDPAAGPETLAAFMRERFEREYDNERRMIAALSKLPTPSSEPAAPADEAAPALPAAPAAREEAADEPSRAANRKTVAMSSLPLKRSEVFKDERSARDITNTAPQAKDANLDGPITSPLPLTPDGPLFGGAASAPARKQSSAKHKAFTGPAGPAASTTADKRATVRYDPLEFVPGAEGVAAPRREGTDKKPALRPVAPAGPASAESVTEPRVQRPISRSRPATRAVGEPPAAEPKPAAAPPETREPQEHAGAAPAPVKKEPAPAREAPEPLPPTGPSIVVAQELSEPVEENKVLVSPELAAPEPPQDGPPTPATPLGIPVFSQNTTSRGIDLRHNSLTIVLIVVGVLCIAAAVVIGVVVFRPAWLGIGAPEQAPASRPADPESEAPTPPDPEPEAAPARAQAPSPEPSPAPAAPPKEAKAASTAAPAQLKDESSIEELPSAPHPKKSKLKKAELERWFDDLDQRFEELSGKYPAQRMLRLASAHELVKKKRALLATAARWPELEVFLGWFEKSMTATERQLEK